VSRVCPAAIQREIALFGRTKAKATAIGDKNMRACQHLNIADRKLGRVARTSPHLPRPNAERFRETPLRTEKTGIM
jgi:hypothetical protein